MRDRTSLASLNREPITEERRHPAAVCALMAVQFGLLAGKRCSYFASVKTCSVLHVLKQALFDIFVLTSFQHAVDT